MLCCAADSQFMAAVFDESGILPTDPGQLRHLSYIGYASLLSRHTTWACHCCFAIPFEGHCMPLLLPICHAAILACQCCYIALYGMFCCCLHATFKRLFAAVSFVLGTVLWSQRHEHSGLWQSHSTVDQCSVDCFVISCC